MLLDNIEEGYQLLMKHIKNDSNICIIIDPDVDGYTSSAVLWNYLVEVFKNQMEYNLNLSYHIPEGKEHGLQTLMPLLKEKCIYDLIILPDSSSNDYEEHKILKDLGYDILVLD